MTMTTKTQLLDALNRGDKVKYLFFWGHQSKQNQITKSCFSQWFESPFIVDETPFKTAEHFMMHQKARLFHDEEAAQDSLTAKNPGEVKAIGRRVKGFDQATWEAHRFDIVVKGNLAKFEQSPEMKQFLLGTGKRVLVEASPVDKIWGIGLAEDNPNCSNPHRWKGENLLGFALMQVRSLLAESSL